MEQIWTDRNISESDPLAKVANNSSTLIFRTLQYMYCINPQMADYVYKFVKFAYSTSN